MCVLGQRCPSLSLDLLLFAIGACKTEFPFQKLYLLAPVVAPIQHLIYPVRNGILQIIIRLYLLLSESLFESLNKNNNVSGVTNVTYLLLRLLMLKLSLRASSFRFSRLTVYLVGR